MMKAIDGTNQRSVLSDVVTELAERVERLTISRFDPERFFEERSEIAQELRRAARQAERG